MKQNLHIRETIEDTYLTYYSVMILVLVRVEEQRQREIPAASPDFSFTSADKNVNFVEIFSH